MLFCAVWAVHWPGILIAPFGGRRLEDSASSAVPAPPGADQPDTAAFAGASRLIGVGFPPCHVSGQRHRIFLPSPGLGCILRQALTADLILSLWSIRRDA